MVLIDDSIYVGYLSRDVVGQGCSFVRRVALGNRESRSDLNAISHTDDQDTLSMSSRKSRCGADLWRWGVDLQRSEYEVVHKDKETGGNSPMDRISKLSK